MKCKNMVAEKVQAQISKGTAPERMCICWFESNHTQAYRHAKWLTTQYYDHFHIDEDILI